MGEAASPPVTAAPTTDRPNKDHRLILEGRVERSLTWVQERVGQVVGAADALDATLGRRSDVVEALAGQVGQLHALEIGPEPLNRVELGRIAR
jgi:hypothetical protein